MSDTAGIVFASVCGGLIVAAIGRFLWERIPAIKSDAPWHWKRSRILIGGAAIVVLILLFPPWHFWINTASTRTSKPGPWAWIAGPPEAPSTSYDVYGRPNGMRYSVGIDYGRLGIELMAVIGLTGIALLIRGRSKP